ncbi:hypothetical protein pipiens_004528, partial [Culex pipiens pipiens]
ERKLERSWRNGFLNCNTNTLQSLAQLHGKLDFHEFIPEF